MISSGCPGRFSSTLNFITIPKEGSAKQQAFQRLARQRDHRTITSWHCDEAPTLLLLPHLDVVRAAAAPSRHPAQRQPRQSAREQHSATDSGIVIFENI